MSRRMSEREEVEVGVSPGGNPLTVHQWSPDCRGEGCHRARVFTTSELAAHVEAVRVSERVRLAGEVEALECDHPGIEHGMWSYTGICPTCRKCKFIGHGPLCGDCYGAAGVRLTEEE